MALYIVGAGGLGRETFDTLLAAGLDVAAFADELAAGATCRGLPVLELDDLPTPADYVVGIADPAVRRRLVGQLEARGLRAATVVHPRATIAPEVTIGVGSVVMAHAYVSSGVDLGDHVHVNYNVTVGHDTSVASFSTLLPGANVAGSVTLGEGVTIGSNACVLQGLTVGHRTLVAAGAVVTASSDEDLVLVGVPARPRTR